MYTGRKREIKERNEDRNVEKGKKDTVNGLEGRQMTERKKTEIWSEERKIKGVEERR